MRADILLSLIKKYLQNEQLDTVLVFDTHTLLDLAQQHQITPVVQALVPTPANDSRQQATMVYLSTLRQLLVIAQAFEAHKIPYFLHKGLHYSSFYTHMTHRPVGDIDLVVQEYDLLKVQKLLLDLGYTRWQSPKADFSIGRDYHWQFIPTTMAIGSSWVEIHWSHSAPWEHIELPIEKVFNNLQKIIIGGRKIAVPAPDDLILLLTIHHGAKERWRKLKYLLDFALIVKHYNDTLDWKGIWEKANGSNLSNYLALGLLLAQKHTQTTVPKWLDDEIHTNKIVRRLAVTYENIWADVKPAAFGTIRNFIFAVRIQSNLSLRLALIKGLLVTVVRDYWKKI